MIDHLLQNPLFNITFFGGIIFILAGFVQFKFPPKKINSLYGYRTVSSMKSQERWEFAQRFAATEMMKLGVLMAAGSLMVLITGFNNSTNLILGLSFMISIVVILLFRVESALKKIFKS